MLFADIRNDYVSVEQEPETTTVLPTNDGVNGGKNDIDAGAKKVPTRKIMAPANNELIKIVSYDVNKKVCSRARLMRLYMYIGIWNTKPNMLEYLLLLRFVKC